MCIIGRISFIANDAEKIEASWQSRVSLRSQIWVFTLTHISLNLVFLAYEPDNKKYVLSYVKPMSVIRLIRPDPAQQRYLQFL